MFIVKILGGRVWSYTCGFVGGGHKDGEAFALSLQSRYPPFGAEGQSRPD